MIECPVRDLFKYKFLRSDRSPIKWDEKLSTPSKVRAIVQEEVQVYGKPHASIWHYEYMRNARLRLSGWSKLSDDELLENMLDLLEKV